METLVSVADKLWSVIGTLGVHVQNVQIPRVVIIGEQSSGKTSVLEKIVGRPLFPIGMTTRRPLIVQLVPDKGADRVVFSHSKDRTYTNENEIKREISCETTRLAGPDRGVNATPIHLKLCSSKVPPVTLIDTPGLVKVPVGDQPVDIEQVVQSIVRGYIGGDALILATVAANTDITTSESLKIARGIDPLGIRTIAVITKLDLMDAGTHAGDLLMGKVVPVKLGIVGVVNRQRTADKTIQTSIKEESFFLKNQYPAIHHVQGARKLVTLVEDYILSRIQSGIPAMKGQLSEEIILAQRTLRSLDDGPDSSPNLLQILTMFTTSFTNTILGTHQELETEEIWGGARLSYVFHEIYAKALDSLDPMDGLNRAAIVTSMRNTAGVKPALFIPQTCFELLVKKQLARLEPPSLACVRLISEEMDRILNHCSPKLTTIRTRYPKLYHQITEIVHDMVQDRIPETNEMVRNIIAIHLSYINTGHPDFLRNRDRIPADKCLVAIEPAHYPDSGDYDYALVEHLISTYFNIVRKIVQDTVPKAIMHFLVNYIMDRLLGELVGRLYRAETIELEESEDAAEMRSATQQRLKDLTEAQRVLTSIQNETN